MKRKLDESENTFEEPPQKKQKATIKEEKCDFTIEYFGGSDKGKKPTLEDRRIEIDNLVDIMSLEFFKENSCKLFGILDGHGGVSVAKWLKVNLPIIFCEQLNKIYIKNHSEIRNKYQLTNEDIINIQKTIHSTFKIADKKVK